MCPPPLGTHRHASPCTCTGITQIARAAAPRPPPPAAPCQPRAHPSARVLLQAPKTSMFPPPKPRSTRGRLERGTSPLIKRVEVGGGPPRRPATAGGRPGCPSSSWPWRGRGAGGRPRRRPGRRRAGPAPAPPRPPASSASFALSLQCSVQRLKRSCAGGVRKTVGRGGGTQHTRTDTAGSAGSPVQPLRLSVRLSKTPPPPQVSPGSAPARR